MALTMQRAKQLTMGFALAMLATVSTVSAQQITRAPAAAAAALGSGKAGQPAPQTAGHPPAQTKSPAKSPANPQAQQASPQDQKGAPPPLKPGARRDPFIGLIGKQPGGAQGMSVKLPPGKAGLQVGTVVLQGIVSGPNGMIAVVANPQKSVYFLRVGDSLFDGRVEKINIDSVTFHEVGMDAFGKPLEREVTKKLNPSSGEQP